MIGVDGIFGSGSVNLTQTRRSRGTASYQEQRQDAKRADYKRKQALYELHQRAAELAGELETFRQSVIEMRGLKVDRKLAAVDSDDGLGLDLSPRATTLDATDEANTAPGSYSTRGPVWDGAQTTSEATLHGDYTGGLTETLEFRARRNGDVGEDYLRIAIYDEGGSYIERLNFQSSDPPGTVQWSSMGIGVSLGAGYVKRNESFFIDVDAGVSQALDPTKAFDGTRTDDPWLEDGMSVTAGSFDINGETISVAADDSVNDVLAAINASAAGVTASYDSGTDRVDLVRDTTGPLDITFASDTSGFVAAMKLDAAVQVTGNDNGEAEEAIEDVAVLSGISTGTFSINGTDVSVDVSADSLQDVVDRINSTFSGEVVASFDANSNKVSLAGTNPSVSLDLDDGTSNFFSGVDVDAQLYAGKQGQTGVKRRVRQVVIDLEEVEDRLNAVFEDIADQSLAKSDIKSARKTLQAGIESLFDDTADLTTEFGIDFDFGESEVLDFSYSDSQELTGAFRTANADVLEFLVGDKDEDGKGGLIGAMMAALSKMGDDLGALHGYSGLLLDIKV